MERQLEFVENIVNLLRALFKSVVIKGVLSSFSVFYTVQNDFIFERLFTADTMGGA